MPKQCDCCEQIADMLDDALKLVSELWKNIENGTVEDNFFELRAKVRKI